MRYILPSVLALCALSCAAQQKVDPKVINWPTGCATGAYVPAGNTCVAPGTAANPGGSVGSMQKNVGGTFGPGVDGTDYLSAVTGLKLTGGVLTGATDSLQFNTSRTNNPYPSNLLVGSLRSYNQSGTIPGTSAYNYGQQNHTFQGVGMLDTVPGCWGFAPVDCSNTEHGLENDGITVNGGGGTNVRTLTANFFSVGDHIGSENYITSFGGSIDGGGPEGTKGASWFVGEASDTWTGAVASGHGGQGQTTLIATCSTDCGSSTYGINTGVPGSNAGSPASVGQGLWVTDEQSTTASGQIESITNWSGETPGTVTVNITGGLSNLVVSTCEATLASTLNPTANPSGSGYQTLTFTVNVVSGTCTSGGLISFTGTNHEQAIISSATAPSGGQQSITANIRLYHQSGSYIFENANSDAGLFADIVANHTGTLSFPFEVLGVQSISGNTAVMWWDWWYAGQGFGENFPYGRMNITSNAAGSLSNTSGTVTMTLNTFGDYTVNHASAVYISNASNSAFNGPCTGVVMTSVTQGSNIITVTCTQSASSGDTATSATVTLTDSTQDNPYGNSRVNFYQGAAIVDPQDESAPIVVNGVTNYPVDGKQFQVEPNEMTLNAGDALVEHHAAGQFHNQDLSTFAVDTNQYNSNGIALSMNGIYGIGGAWNNNVGIGLNNVTPTSQYQYFGGTLPPIDYMNAQGLWANFLNTNYPPTYGDSFINVRSCPPSPSSCTDPSYHYNLFSFPGNGTTNTMSYYPDTNTFQWPGSNTFTPPTIAMSGGLTGAFLNFTNANHNFTGYLGGLSYSAPSPVIPVWSNTPTAGGDAVEVGACNSGLCGIKDAGAPPALNNQPITPTAVAVNNGHSYTRHTIVTAILSPSLVAADTCAATGITVTGLNVGDHVINRDVEPSFTTGLSLTGIIVTGANTASMNWCNNTAAAITPPSGTYTFDVEQ